MKKNFLFLVLATLVAVVALAFGAAAYSVNGTNINLGQQATVWQGDAASSISAEGGNITALNIEQNTLTTNWQVFYGNVSKKLTLKSSAGVSIYDWGVTNLSKNEGYVIFSDTSSVVWSSITSCTAASCQIPEDHALGLTDIDNVTSTFVTSNHQAISLASSSITADSAPTVSLNGTGGVKWNEALLRDTSTNNNTLYLAFINVSHNSFYGNKADYQIMVPTNASNPLGNLRTYYVFAALP